MPSKFDFISPDILLREVDMSELPPDPTDDGILIIGQAKKGPAMKPIRLKNTSDLKAIFGEPYLGDPNGDIYRNGNTANPTYGMFAAQAWLASNTSPVTFVRLAGEETGTTFSVAKAGWDLGGQAKGATATANRLAYGLWMVPSSSGNATGTLAAIFYTLSASLALSGTIAGTAVDAGIKGMGTMIKSVGDNGGFMLNVSSASGLEKLKFDMSPGGSSFIRNACNTDPQKLVSNQKAETKKYFLGETFETEIMDMINTSTSSSAGQIYGLLVPLALESDISKNWIDHTKGFTAARTGWFIGNDPTPQTDASSFDAANMKKLFKFHSLIEGSEFSKRYALRLVIDSLGTVTNPYTSFTVKVFDMHSKQDVSGEIYSCNLNPLSDNYIAKVIGDQSVTYNATKEKFVTTGEFPNQSNMIRVEMSGESYADNVIPFGFYGPAKPKSWAVAGHATPGSQPTTLNVGTNATYVLKPSGSGIHGVHTSTGWADYRVTATASFDWPSLNLTDSNSSGVYTKKHYFGFRHQQSASSNSSINQQYQQNAYDYIDILRELPDSTNIDLESTGSATEFSFIFTLDEVVQDSADTNRFFYDSGSHGKAAAARAVTAASGNVKLIEDFGINKIVAPFMGGTDGVDITLVDPFSMQRALTGNKNNDYAFAAVDKAIDFIKDPEFVKYDVVAMPGIHKTTLVDELLGNTEERGDALAIIDVDSGFQSALENKAGETAGSVSDVVSAVKSADYNTSYGATYYPEVKIRVNNGSLLTVPSSVAGIGAIASSEAASGAPWFAPAGFNRGGIKKLGGPTGPSVGAVAETLNKADRDDLYLVNVNPIANFPGEGPVVFGQKTLQQTPSALDRINVRRLMITLKKSIGQVARTILFDNNVQATWNRFKAGAEPILADAKSRFGLADYKLVLDETTTTPDYVDRNIMYAKVFIKPAYAIEFIAIDFNITRSGIEF